MSRENSSPENSVAKKSLRVRPTKRAQESSSDESDDEEEAGLKKSSPRKNSGKMDKSPPPRLTRSQKSTSPEKSPETSSEDSSDPEEELVARETPAPVEESDKPVASSSGSSIKNGSDGLDPGTMAESVGDSPSDELPRGDVEQSSDGEDEAVRKRASSSRLRNGRTNTSSEDSAQSEEEEEARKAANPGTEVRKPETCASPKKSQQGKSVPVDESTEEILILW